MVGAGIHLTEERFVQDSITIVDEISGSPRVIKNPLRPRHIKTGRLIRFDGFTSTGGWNCPAIIVRVDRKRRRFRIRSLDDMQIQDCWYDFSLNKHAHSGRKTMRLIDTETVVTYLKGQAETLALQVKLSQTELRADRARLKHFKAERAKLKLP